MKFMPSQKMIRSCGIFSPSTTTRAFVRWRKRDSLQNLRYCKPAQRRWAGWLVADLLQFTCATLELERYDHLGETDATGSISNVVPLSVARSERLADIIWRQ